MNQEATMNWFDDYANVLRLGRWLIEECNFTALDLQRYYEKPWNWGDEYRQMINEEKDAGVTP